MNATRHGLTAAAVVLPHVEAAGDWEAHRAGVLASLAPDGYLEAELAERIALLLWRLRRVARWETAILAAEQDDAESDAVRRVTRRGLAGLGDSDDPMQTDSLEELRDEARHCEQTYKALAHIRGLADDAPATTDDAVDAIHALAKRAGLDIDEDDIPVPGVPDEISLVDWTTWTAGLVRGSAAAMAARKRETAEDFYRSAALHAAQQAGRTTRRVQLVERRLARMRGQRVMLSPVQTQHVQRYEAHLERALSRALGELARLRESRPESAGAAVVVQSEGAGDAA